MNFTRAAIRLGIGQPPLSMQIKDLEAEIGFALFYRLPHGVELTDAGRAFYDAVKNMPEHATEAIIAAQRAARGEFGKINIGLTGTSALNHFVSASIREFRRTYPETDMRLEEANSIALINGLMDGRLDVAILRPSESDPDDIKVINIAEEELVVALPVTHHLAQSGAAISLYDLRHDPIILTPRDVGTSLHDSTLKICREAGFEPKLGQPAPQIASILSMVAAELGISLVPASMKQLSMDGVRFMPIQAPIPHIFLGIAYRKIRPSNIALNFVNIMRNLSDNEF